MPVGETSQQREKYITVLSPVKGLDLRKPSTLLDLRKTPKVKNARFAYGEILKRPGRAQFSDSATPLVLGGAASAIMRLDQYFLADGTDHLLGWSLTKVARYNAATDAFVDITRTALTGDADNKFSADYYPSTDKFYFTNYIDTIEEWDGAAATTAELYTAATLRARIVLNYAGHLNFYNCVDGGTVVPQRVKWTDTASTALTGGTSGSNDLRDGSDHILDARLLGGRVAIYKERSIVMQEHVGGSQVYRFTTRISGIGLYAQDCIADMGGEHIFLGSDLHVYRFDGGNELVPISDEVVRDIQALVDPTNGGRSFMTVVEELNEVWLCIVRVGRTQPDYVFAWNFIDRTWTQYEMSQQISTVGFYRRTSTIAWDDAPGTWEDQTDRWDDRVFETNLPITLIGDKNGKITKLDALEYDDDGTAMEVFFDTPDVPNQADYTRRFTRVLNFNFEARGTAVDVYYSTDEGTTYNLLETVTLTTDWARYNVELDVTDEKIRFRLKNDKAGGRLQARAFEIGYVERGALR